MGAGHATPSEGFISAGDAALWYRDTGSGRPIIVLHGGPELNCRYLLPELDALSDDYRLIYYDQRGRGRSAGNVRPEEISIRSEIEDIERVRRHFQLGAVTVLGHSWGGLLAMEYAVRFPDSVSHMILLNSAFTSGDERFLFREERNRRLADGPEELQSIASSAGFQSADPDVVAAYNRIHFSATLRRPEHLDAVVERTSAGATAGSILQARAIETRLVQDTWLSEGYDLLPALQRINTPALVIHGDEDFIPVSCAERIAGAIPGAQFVLLPDCGHFSYLECPDAVHAAIDAFYQSTGGV